MRTILFGMGIGLILLAPARADGWVHSGARWSHPATATTVTVPAGLKAEVDKDGDLRVTTQGLFVSLMPRATPQDAARMQAALAKSSEEKIGVKLGPPQQSKLADGWVLTQNGQGTWQGANMAVQVGTENRRGHFLVFMTMVDPQNAARFKPQIDSLMDSLTFK